MRTRMWLLAVIVAAAICGPLVAGPADGLPVGQPAPQFMLKTHAGDDFYLRDFAGEARGKRFRQERNVVVLSFFASWCKPCKQEIPVLHELAADYAADGVKFFLVNKGEEKGVVDNAIFEDKITLPVLLDPYEVACKKFKIKELPTLVVIDKTGNVTEYRTGYKTGDDKSLKEVLNKALGKVKTPPPPKVDSAAIKAKAKADSIEAAKAKKKKGAVKKPAAKAGEAKTPAAQPAPAKTPATKPAGSK